MAILITAIMITSVLLVSAFALVMPVNAADKYLWEQVSEEGFSDLTNDYAWSMASYTVNVSGNETEYLYVGTFNTNFSSNLIDPANWSNVTDGCEIWRTNGTEGLDGKYVWEQVVGPNGTQDIILLSISVPPPTITVNATAGFGGFNFGARKMLVYKDLLWVGTMRPACEVWVTNGTHWKRANIPGFSNVLGPVIGNNSTSVRSMAIFNDSLYVGVDNAQTGAMVMKYTGSTNFDDIGNIFNINKWDRVNVPGFGEPETNLGVGELVTFSASEEYLYAGTWNGTGPQLIGAILNDWNFSSLVGCQVWRTNGTVNASDPPRLIWEQVDDNGFGDPLNGAVMSSAVFNGSLYMGTMNFGTGAEIWRTANGTDWEYVADLGFFNFTLMPPPPTVDFRGFGNGYMWCMINFSDALFVGTLNPILGCQVWMSTTGDPGSFEQVNINGMNNDRKIPIGDLDGFPIMGIDQYGVRTFAAFNGNLHLGTASFGDWIDKIIGTNYSENVGCEIWRTNGTYTEPTLVVTKTVWNGTVWVDELDTYINETVRFKWVLNNTGVHNMTNIAVIDFLSYSLEYADEATEAPNETFVYNLSGPFNEQLFTLLIWDFTSEPLEHGENITVEYNATVIKCGADINFLAVMGQFEGIPEEEWGYGYDYALIYVPCSSGDATDSVGGVQEVYNTGEPVYATGSGFAPNGSVDIYIVDDYAWVGGENITDYYVYASLKDVPTDAAGNIASTEIWPNPIPGEYDMVFDANQNEIYDVGVDVVDHPAHPGFTVEGQVQVPALTPIGIIALVGLLTIIATSTILRSTRKKR